MANNFACSSSLFQRNLTYAGNEMAKTGSESKFIGSEPYFDLSYRPVRQAVEEWKCKEHTEYWLSY